MPPRRRKLSIDDIDAAGRDSKRQVTDIAGTSETDLKGFDVESEKSIDPYDTKKPKTKLSGELSTADGKVKDDAPKPTRISERLISKRNRLGDVEETENHNQACLPPQTTPKKPRAARQRSKSAAGKKNSRRRPWELWGVMAKKLFFLGLGEFGKNFQAISNKISHVAKAHGHPPKDKMQVQYFYYRCWAKISKFIDLKGEDVKSKTQELYGLINYGVLRKHVKEKDPQFGRCLNELIHYGETTYTMKSTRGKKARVGKLRTPVCPYLKKINKIEERQAAETSSSKVPQQITLELTPKSSKAWGRVQSMSQNPRLRMKVASHRTLESVFLYLENKWKEQRMRQRGKLCVSEEPDEELIFHLHPSFKVVPVSFIPQEPQKVDVTFSNFKEHILPTLEKPKKPRAKEIDKTASEKEKVLEENQGEGENENISSTTSSEQTISSQTRDTSEPPGSEQSHIIDGKEQPTALAHLLAAAAGDMAAYCISDITSVAHTGGQNVLADTPVGPIPPTVLLEDENAMFPDTSPFSPPSYSSNDTSKPSVILNSPSSSSSSLPPSTAATVATSVILSPSVSKRKSAKSVKKGAVSDDLPTDNCDNLGIVPATDSSSSPSKHDSSSLQELKDKSEKEISRLTELTAEGFTKGNSSTVTLFHLSIILGRESNIRLEYDWREKKAQKTQSAPMLQSLVANQMSNVLRRLCNLAALELTEYGPLVEKVTDQNKPPKKNIPCAHCGREGPSRSRSKKTTERKESCREVATMTDLSKLEPVAIAPLLHPAPLAAGNGRTFVAGPATSGAIRISGPDPVFRVPFIPSHKPVLSREEQQRLEEQQRIQQQAKAIMQQAPTARHRLLKKRTLSSRNRKPPPIIVQRTLLPKVDSGQMVTFIQQPSPQPVSGSMVVSMTPDNLVKVAHPVLGVVTTNTKTQPVTSFDEAKGANAKQTTDILALAAQTAEITASSDDISEKAAQSQGNPPVSEAEIHSSDKREFPPLSVVTTTAPYPISIPADLISPALSAQGDISISDFDISMSSVTGSNMGPDAGDKFLDMVLHNSEQGFSGLIGTPKKSSDNTEPYQSSFAETTASFDSSILRTPPHFGIASSSYGPTTSIYPSPGKFAVSVQPWMNSNSSDISLSSFLSDSSPSKKEDQSKLPEKTTSNYPAFFDTGSSDVPESANLIFSKPPTVSDLSLPLLGDPSFQKDDAGGVSPPLPSSTITKPDSTHGEGGIFRDVVTAEGPPPLFSETSQDSFSKLDDDGAFQGMVNDSSLDLVSKFESLAAHITERQDQDLGSGAEKPEKLPGNTAKVEQAIRIESPSTAS